MMFIIFKGIIIWCPCFAFINDDSIKDAVYVLFREVVLALSCILALEALYYYEIVTYKCYIDSSDNIIVIGNETIPSFTINGATYCTLLTLFFYAVLGFIFCIMAQK